MYTKPFSVMIAKLSMLGTQISNRLYICRKYCSQSDRQSRPQVRESVPQRSLSNMELDVNANAIMLYNIYSRSYVQMPHARNLPPMPIIYHSVSLHPNMPFTSLQMAIASTESTTQASDTLTSPPDTASTSSRSYAPDHS